MSADSNFELTGEQVDKLMKEFARYIEYQDSKDAFVNLTGVKKVNAVYNYLSDAIKSQKKVSMLLHEPFKNVGSVTVVAKKVLFKNPNDFICALKMADTLSVYPRTDGKIQLDFGFNDLADQI